MKEKFSKKTGLLIVACLFLFFTLFYSSKNKTLVKAKDYDTKLAAATRMEDAMEAVKEYKKELDISLSPEDYHQTGMIGEEFNFMTTTQGHLPAKRTTANGDMAAMIVDMLNEAGLKKGDTVGASFSGSFPALNIAVLSACEELELNVIAIASIGASTYGGNNPELTSPEMIIRLIKDGYFSDSLRAVTIGGGNDVGLDMDVELREFAVKRIEQQGVNVFREPDYIKNLKFRKDMYGTIQCFVGVGGNIATIGRDREIKQRGLILPNAVMDTLSSKSGLIEIYHNQGVPVIHLLNVKTLVTEYSLEFDPLVLPKPGTSGIYYEFHYSKIPIMGTLVLVALLLLIYRKAGKKNGDI